MSRDKVVEEAIKTKGGSIKPYFSGQTTAVITKDATSAVTKVIRQALESVPPIPIYTMAALRSALDTALFGSGLAKDRAANALTTVMIPEALDYPI